MKAIRVRNAGFTYPDGIEVFRDVSFSVEKNESAAIIGPNGAGKTTLLLALAGLLESSGDIFIAGERMTKNNIADLRKKMSVVFQNPDDQLFMPHVREDVAFGLDKLGLSADEVDTAVKESLRSVGLEGFEQRSSHHLSLGQKKRVCLASAFARRPEILLLDEPSNELDPGGKRELTEVIRMFGGTMVIVSHDLNLIATLCTKVMIINHRRIIASGEVRDILSDRKLMEENSLEVPYVFRG